MWLGVGSKQKIQFEETKNSDLCSPLCTGEKVWSGVSRNSAVTQNRWGGVEFDPQNR